jgi:hypothetical protein
MYLFQEFFYEKNPDRLQEYIFCIKKNVELPFIQKIFLLIDVNEYDRHRYVIDNVIKFINSAKVVLIQHNDAAYSERITFNTILFEIIPDFVYNRMIEPDSIIGLANLDIFLQNSEEWKYVDTDFFSVTNNKACLALCRMEYVNDDFIFKNEEAWKAGYFCDAWFMKLPIKIDEDDFILEHSRYPSAIPLGNAPGCDNIMFEVLSKKYKVFNWAEKYIIYHYDIARKPSVKNGIPADMIINEKCIKLNTSITRSISPYKNWESFLEKFKDKNFVTEFDIACDNIKYNWELLHPSEEEHIINLSKKINTHYEH